MRLVFVHGMRQEGKDPEELRVAWRDSLRAAWARNGLPALPVEPEMPFYGDLLDQLTRDLHKPGQVVHRGGEDSAQISDFELEFLNAVRERYGLGDDYVRAELASEVVAKGPANWEWVQAVARALETHVPPFRALGLSAVQQVDAYLNRLHVQQAVEAIVEPFFKGGPLVIVSHSLGTIVTYRILQRLAGGGAKIPFLVTAGSPLGINAVKDRIKPPKLGVPKGVARWLNTTDEKDYVALFAKLDKKSFADGIENDASVKNGKADAHSITDYLGHKPLAVALHKALTT